MHPRVGPGLPAALTPAHALTLGHVLIPHCALGVQKAFERSPPADPSGRQPCQHLAGHTGEMRRWPRIGVLGELYWSPA